MAARTDPFAAYRTLTGPPASSGSRRADFGATGASGLAPQPVSGANDSLTAFFRSLTNLTGGTGASLYNTGANTVGTGLGTVGLGLEAQNAGLGTLQPSIDFYSKILSGDPAAIQQALAPTATALSQSATSAEQQVGQNSAMGGFRSTALAGLPFAQSAQLGNAALNLQPEAAQELNTLAGTQAGIGRGISETGLGTAGIGTTEQAQGLQALMSTIQAMLGKMGINIQGSFANQFATIAQGINALI